MNYGSYYIAAYFVLLCLSPLLSHYFYLLVLARVTVVARTALVTVVSRKASVVWVEVKLVSLNVSHRLTAYSAPCPQPFS